MAEQSSFLFDDNELLLGDLQLKRPLVLFDLETTGLDIQNDRIIQFAFLRVNPDRRQEEWTELVNPGRPIPEEAIKVHHITDDKVADKPLFKDFAPLILKFLENCDLSGFNIGRFDLPFLQAEMERNDYQLDLKSINIIDAQVIYHKKEPRDLSAAFRFYCGGQHINAHDAMGDVRATLDILDAQIKKYKDIPKDLDELNKFCSIKDDRCVTSDRKFMWKDDKAVITFGKHRGKSLKWLADNEREYLLWMQNGDFSNETKMVITDALAGQFPIKENE